MTGQLPSVPGQASPAEIITVQGLTPQSHRFRKQIVSVSQSFIGFRHADSHQLSPQENEV